MSKKITDLVTKTALLDTDWLTGIDNAAADADKNIKISRANLLTGLASETSVSDVQQNLDDHEAVSSASAHPDGTTATDLNNHRAGSNQHPIGGVTGLQGALNLKANTADLGDAAYKDTGTTSNDVAAGNAPVTAVGVHNALASAHNGNLSTAAQKAALDANPSLSGSNAAASMMDIVDEGSDLKSTGQPGTKVLQTDGLGGFAYIDTPAGGGGGDPTDLGAIYDADSVVITSSTGLDVDIVAAVPSGNAGFLTGVAAKKLEDLPDQEVTPPEIAAGTQTELRSFSPKDVADMALAHGPAPASTDLGNAPAATTVQVTSSTGSDTTLPAAVPGGNAGMFTGVNATKLQNQPNQQVSAPEIAAGTETALRTFSPKDVADMAEAHAPAPPPTNLTTALTAVSAVVQSSTGTNAAIPAAVAGGDAGVLTGAVAQSIIDNASAIALKLPITGGEIANYGEAENDLGNVAATANVSLADGVVHYAVMTGNTTFTLVNPSAHAACSLTFLMDSGGFSSTFTGVVWAGATPDLSADATYLLAFFFINGTWYGVLAA